MKNIITTALLPLLAGLAFSCSSSTALQTTESDDLYYASSDKTTRPEQTYGGYSDSPGTVANQSNEDATNPEYVRADGDQPAVINNYNYYDSHYSRNSYGGRFRNYNYYGYDPFYSPFGYSAAYCYNLYDPFWYPYCYPSGFSVSIGFGFGSPYYGYGYGYPYGYRSYGYPYDYYGGYGSYYHGFYDGYYAGGGYGYGYHRNRVNYGPRHNRSNAPANAPRSVAGRPSEPGRIAQPSSNGSGTMIPGGGRPHRVSQTGGGTPGQVAQPAGNSQPQPGRVSQGGRPARNQQTEQNVQPQNYQFQEAPQQPVDYARPSRGDVAAPAQAQPGRPMQDMAPASQPAPVQMEQSGRSSRNQATYQQQQPTYQQQQPAAPVYENSRPARTSSGNDGGGSYQAPSRGSYGSGSGSGSGTPGGGSMGRPRR